MATDSVSGLDLLSQTKNPSKAELASKQLTSDYTFFLKMLTTQLQNQDPTEPMDVSQMTQQIATYTGVEQAVQTNKLLESMIAGQKQSQLGTAVSYIGREVEMEGNTGSLYYGQATFSYTLPHEAENVQLTITNSKGQAVFSGDGPKVNGRNVVVWDGKNSFTGETMPSGKYTITVKAKDAAGKDISATTHSVGIVTTVETDKDGAIKLTVGDQVVDFDKIVAVRDATPIISPNDPNGGGDTAGGGDTGTGTGTDTVTGSGDENEEADAA